MTDAPGIRPRPDAAARPPDADNAADQTSVIRHPPAQVPRGYPAPPASTIAYVVTPATPATPSTPAPRGRQRAKLSVASVDPWSVFRFTLVFSVTLLIVWLVVAAVLWSLLNGMHVLDSLTSLVNDTFLNSKDRTVDELFNFNRMMVWAAGLGVINAILFTALGTLGAFVYNLCARIVGGIEVTLAERG